MLTLVLVAFLAFSALVLVTFFVARGVPRFVCYVTGVVTVAVIVAIPLSFRARAKAILIGEILMEPARAPEFERSVQFEPLAIAWTVNYHSRQPYGEDQAVSVGLLGHVEVGAKYFGDRAREVSIR